MSDALADGDPSVNDGASNPPPCSLWNPHHFEPCEIVPSDDITTIEQGAVFDTTTGVLTVGSATVPIDTELRDLGGQQVRVWSLVDLEISSGVTLRAYGQYPLLVAAAGSITVAGSIDVASRGTERGAGSRTAPCAAMLDGADHWSGTGGGAGGSYQGRGGNGGTGDGITNIAGGVAGDPLPAPSVIQGGCDGGRGGNNTRGNPGRAGAGLGGGAIQLSARLAITVSGVIHAGGGGGRGAPDNTASGGGGGGSGGLIGLDAPSISLEGSVLAANGGAGGGSAPFVGTGTAGSDATPDAQAASCAASGTGTCGIEGGSGSAGANVDGVTVTVSDICGGGGGGGGAGYILWWTASPTGQVTASPSLQAGPP